MIHYDTDDVFVPTPDDIKDFSSHKPLYKMVDHLYREHPLIREIFSLDMFDLTKFHALGSIIDVDDPLSVTHHPRLVTDNEIFYYTVNGDYKLTIKYLLKEETILTLSLKYKKKFVFIYRQHSDSSYRGCNVNRDLVVELASKKAVGKDLEGVLEL